MNFSRRFSIFPLFIWSTRDLMRRPGESLLLGGCLILLTTIIATILMLTQALVVTARDILSKGPSLVIRRVTPHGWAPVPAAEALQQLRSVPGVMTATARVWGVARGPRGPVTIVGLDSQSPDQRVADLLKTLPEHGEAVVGIGVLAPDARDTIELFGAQSLNFRVVSTINDSSAAVTWDLVLLTPDDARDLLGIPRGFAADIAVTVFYEEESEPLRRDLVDVLSWPTRIVLKEELMGSFSTETIQRSGMVLILYVPAILALVLLGIVTIKGGYRRRHEMGLLKSIGWTQRDIVTFWVLRTFSLGVLAVTLGLAVAYILVFWPDNSWIASVFLGWQTVPLPLNLNPSGMALVMGEVAALILVPWVVMALWPAIRFALADPIQLIQQEQ